MKKQFLLISTSLLFVAVFSCKEQIVEEQKESMPLQSDNYSNARETAEKADEPMVLGKKLQNPYSVENMKTAYNNLKNIDKDVPKIIIKSNYKYIRFLPKTDEEYNSLGSDENLDLFDYPLDFEITKKGNSYKDPSTNSNKYTWYYTTIPLDYEIPKKIQSEVLADLFLPKGNGNANSPEKLNKNTIIQDESFIEDLENEALRITGNLVKSKNGKVASYVPYGYISVWDDFLTVWKPVKGCKVKTRRWFSTETALTNDIGYYNIGVSYNNDANFSIEWSRADFDIRDGNFNQAYFNGPQQSGSWSLNINSGDSWNFATAHRALYEYYYHNLTGLRNPPTVTGLNKMSIAVHGSSNPNSKAIGDYTNHFNGPWSAIRLWCFSATNTKRSDALLFGSLIHELAHSSHWNMNCCSNYSNTEARVAESWAEGVMWAFSRIEYGGSYGDPNTYNDNLQNRSFTTAFGKEYSSIIVDLIDNVNQRQNSINLPNDRVSGYTIREIEDAVRNTRTWNGLRDNLKNMYNNPTEDNLDELFANWN